MDRRWFLEALAAFTATPAMARVLDEQARVNAIQSKRLDVERAMLSPFLPDTQMGVLMAYEQTTGHPWSDIRRSAARLRAIRRFA